MTVDSQSSLAWSAFDSSTASQVILHVFGAQGETTPVHIAFDLKKILAALVLPPTSLLLVAMLGLVLLRRWPRLGRSLAWIGVVVLLALSLPVTSSALLDLARTGAPFSSAAAANAQAIVILGGGQRYAPEYGGATVSQFSLQRVRYGAKLARDLKLPILVTGGSVYANVPEARLMADALRESFLTPVQWIEARSRDTHENAAYSAQILHQAGIGTVVLVTHDIHQRRSIAEFSAVGIHAIPAPITTISRPEKKALPQYFPSAGSLQSSALALHELIGYLVLAPKDGE